MSVSLLVSVLLPATPPRIRPEAHGCDWPTLAWYVLPQGRGHFLRSLVLGRTLKGPVTVTRWMCGMPHPLNGFGREVSQACILQHQERNSASQGRGRPPAPLARRWCSAVGGPTTRVKLHLPPCYDWGTVCERAAPCGLACSKPCLHKHGFRRVSQADVTDVT